VTARFVALIIIIKLSFIARLNKTNFAQKRGTENMSNHNTV